MREILFKAKGQTDEKWHIGFLANLHGGICIIRENTHEWICQADTICQYTGLTDKNGNKIWENDIVDASNCWWDAAGPAGHTSPIIKVEWSEGYCGFNPFACYDCDCGVYIESCDVEAIGNVFDNPELLKGE